MPRHRWSLVLIGLAAVVALILASPAASPDPSQAGASGAVMICKHTLPAGSSQPFAFSGPLPANTQLSDGGCASVNVVAEPWIFTETVPTGWTLVNIDCLGSPRASDNEATGSVAINVTAGSSDVCHFYNVQDPVNGGSLTFCKETLTPDPGITFTFAVTGLGSFPLDRRECVTLDLPPDTYQVSEIVPEGWLLGDIDCGEDPGTVEDEANLTAIVDLAAGDEVTCGFTNFQPGQGDFITICKDTEPAGSMQGFVFEGPFGFGVFQLSDGRCTTSTRELIFGDYEFSELVPDGWELTEIDCGDPASTTIEVNLATEPQLVVGLLPGEDITCTFLNTQLESGDDDGTGGGSNRRNNDGDPSPAATPLAPGADARGPSVGTGDGSTLAHPGLP